MTICNDGTVVNRSGSFITTSKGETYTLTGSMLVGSNGFKSMNVKSISEAEGIVIGLHGGKRL